MSSCWVQTSHVLELKAIQCCHNEHDGVWNQVCQDCLLICLLTRRSKKTSKLCITGLCEGNPLVTGGFPSQRASNMDKASIWRYHHEIEFYKNTWCSYQYNTDTIRCKFNRSCQKRCSDIYCAVNELILPFYSEWKMTRMISMASCKTAVSYTLSREYRVVRYWYSWLLFTNEDLLCANLRVQEQSTNMMSQCQCPTFVWRYRSIVVMSQC